MCHLIIPFAKIFSVRTRLFRSLALTSHYQPNIALPIRPSTHPLPKPSMEEPLNINRIQDVCTIWLSPLPWCCLYKHAYSEAWHWLDIVSQTFYRTRTYQSKKDRILLLLAGGNESIAMRESRKNRWGNLESVPKLSSRVILVERMTMEAGRKFKGVHTLGIPAPTPIVKLVLSIRKGRDFQI